MGLSPGAAGAAALFESIERARSQRRTGLLEFDVREQRRSLPIVGGELHLPDAHPHAAQWKQFLTSPRTREAVKEISSLLEQLADSMRDWGAVRDLTFHEGHARLPAAMVGPLPTGKLLRVAAARDPRAGDRVATRFGSQKLVGENPASAASFVWTPEELWVLERLRQPSTLTELERECPIPRDALRRAVAGLAATGQVRTESGPRVETREDGLGELARKLADRMIAQLDVGPAAVAGAEDFRHRIAALLSHAGGLDHYELLGLGTDAAEDDARSAFEELARLVHPANAKRHGAPELEDALRFLFERATEAYQTLTDPGLRVAYRATLQLPVPEAEEMDPADRAREIRLLARQEFDRAQAEERNGDYHTALTLYESAVQHDPTIEHWSALARLQEKNPAWTQRAIDSWRAALALDPQNGGVRFALGELYEKSGDVEQAAHLYQAAANSSTPVAAAAAALDRLREGRSKSDVRGSGSRRLSSLFRRS